MKRGYKIEVNAEKGSTVSFNGKNIDREGEESKQLGVYILKGQKRFDYPTVKDETKVTLFYHGDFKETASLNFSSETVTVSSDIQYYSLG